MPTQEERLTALEQTFATLRKENAIHIREVDENTTIMLGVIRDQGRDIKRIVQRLETIDERLHTLEQRFDTLEQRFDTLEQHFDTLEQRFDTLEQGFNALEQHFDTLEQRIESRFETSEKKLDQVLHLLTTLTTEPGQET